VTRTPDSTRRLKLACDALAIDPNTIHTLPPISSQLAMIGRKLKKRKLPISPYYYLKCSPGESARRIVALYYSLPKNQREILPIEGYCLAVGVNPTDILETIVKAIASVSRQASAAIAAANHPAVVEKTVEMALTDEGIEDRTTLHKAVGFLPTPKGSQITVNASANAASTAQAAALPAPPPEATIKRLIDRFNDARALGPASTTNIIDSLPRPESIPVMVEVDSDEDEE